MCVCVMYKYVYTHSTRNARRKDTNHTPSAAKRCTNVTNANTIIKHTSRQTLLTWTATATLYTRVAAHCNNQNITIHCTANLYFNLSTHKVTPPMGRMLTQQLVFLQPAKRHCARAQVTSTGTYPLIANAQQSWDGPS